MRDLVRDDYESVGEREPHELFHYKMRDTLLEVYQIQSHNCPVHPLTRLL